MRRYLKVNEGILEKEKTNLDVDMYSVMGKMAVLHEKIACRQEKFSAANRFEVVVYSSLLSFQHEVRIIIDEGEHKLWI